ncbi:MAG: branched-chain amino acid ABC transporter permease [Pseudomonadota bacterium]
MGVRNKIGVLVLIAVIIPLPFILGVWEATSYYPDVLVFTAIFSIISTGLCLLLGFAGQISLGHAAFYGIGAYTSGILTTQLGISPWTAAIAGMFLAGVTAYGIGVPSLRLRGHYLAMATLGFGVIVYIVFNECVTLTGGPSGFGGIPRLSLFGVPINSTIRFYYLSWFLAILVLIVSLNTVHSRVGRALRAIHGSEIASRTLGVDAAKYKVRIFVLSAVFGALAGSLYAHFVTFINPQPFDIFFSLKLLMMVVIGGTGNVWGAFAGAGLLTFLPEWLTFLEDLDVLAYGLLLLAIVMFFPEGIIGIAGRVHALGRKLLGKA